MLTNYVITDGTRFIYKNYKNKYVPISSEAMADVYNKKQAETIYKNRLPKALKRVFYVKCIDESRSDVKQVDSQKTYNIEETCEIPNITQWLDKIDTLNGLIQEATKRKQELINSLTTIDRELSDIIHYIEFCNLNAAQGYSAYKMIRERRIKRRVIKNELSVINVILDKESLDHIEDKIEKTVNGLKNHVYEPRVLTELFN